MFHFCVRLMCINACMCSDSTLSSYHIYVYKSYPQNNLKGDSKAPKETLLTRCKHTQKTNPLIKWQKNIYIKEKWWLGDNWHFTHKHKHIQQVVKLRLCNGIFYDELWRFQPTKQPGQIQWRIFLRGIQWGILKAMIYCMK